MRDIILKPETKKYTPIYDDIRPFTLPMMNGQEILAEKIRAILKRDKARDMYDLAFLLDKGNTIDLDLVNKKMDYYQEEFSMTEFERQLHKKEDIWTTELRGLVRTIPSFEETSQKILQHIKQPASS
jgi:hypothetical protein